jgi:hypothetical protein
MKDIGKYPFAAFPDISDILSVIQIGIQEPFNLRNEILV